MGLVLIFMGDLFTSWRVTAFPSRRLFDHHPDDACVYAPPKWMAEEEFLY
jgi:hypothetical protein